MTDGPGSRAAWIGAALERFEQPLLRYALRYTGNAELAREVVQDTFLRLCEADRARVDGHLTAWLYTVCRNRALDVRKKETRMNPLAEEQARAYPSRGPSPGAVAAGNEVHERVLAAVQSLPDREQEAFRLKFQDDLSYREISQVMGVSLGTVSKLVTTALDALRHELEGELGRIGEVQHHDA